MDPENDYKAGAEGDEAIFFFSDDDDPLDRPIMAVALGHHLDLEAYANLYTGRTKVSRLLFIAGRCCNEAMHLEALRLAYDEIKKGKDSPLHLQVASMIAGRLGPDYALDQEWVHAVGLAAEKRKNELQNDLTNLTKESIWMGYKDLGDFYYEHGQLADAFKNYTVLQDTFTISKHIIQMCLNVFPVNIEMGQFTHLLSYARRALQLSDPRDPVTVSKIQCALGIAHIETKDYKQAAYKFLEIGFELGNNYTEVVAPQDVAIYGGVCALASFDWMELKNKVINNTNFQNYLELVPEVRELINDFCESHYASYLEKLEKLKPNLLLDIHLHDHVERLYTLIRQKAIIHYTRPFISVDLHTMAGTFKTSVSGLEKELEDLITRDQIQARIDSQNKILYARHVDQRNTTFQQVLQSGVEFDWDVRVMLLRASLIKLENTLPASRKY